MATVQQRTLVSRLEQARAHKFFPADKRADVTAAGGGGGGGGGGGVTLVVIKIVAGKVTGTTVCRAAAGATILEIAEAAAAGGSTSSMTARVIAHLGLSMITRLGTPPKCLKAW